MDRDSRYSLVGRSLELIIIDPWELHAADGTSRLAAEVVDADRSAEPGADQILIRLTAPLVQARISPARVAVSGLVCL
jgi:hypothetical protein